MSITSGRLIRFLPVVMIAGPPAQLPRTDSFVFSATLDQRVDPAGLPEGTLAYCLIPE